MSEEISNGDLLKALWDIRGDLGGLKASATTTATLLEKHDTRIGLLEAGAQRQKGATKVVMTAGTVLGAVGGVLATWWTGKH